MLFARELRSVAGNGKSRPLHIDCVDSDGKKHNVVLKLRDPQTHAEHPWNLCLVRDLVGATIARRLGLLVPDYALVDVGAAFLQAIASHPEGPRLAANEGMNFGSIRIDGASESSDGSHFEWSPVMAFDALGLNNDRHGSNPNVLWTGERLYLIDHGMLAPTWTFHVDGTNARSLYGLIAIRLHAAFRIVEGRGETFELTRRWPVLITDPFLSWLRAQVPSTWSNESELDELFQFLAARGDIAISQQEELREVVG